VEILKVGKHGIDVAATLTVVGEGLYRLEIDGFNDYSSKDHLTAGEFLPVLTKRRKPTLNEQQILSTKPY
jgi:hypothetical protein